MDAFVFAPEDLAPGDGKSTGFDPATVRVDRVTSREDPLFEFAYERLWAQFGAANEIETRDVLGWRLTWDPAQRRDDLALLYELVLVRDLEGNFVAARDHTAIADEAGAVVHLSHALVDPAWRRGGLAGWLRAFPIQTARRCLAGAGLSSELPITLAAEMEYPDGIDEARNIRLRAYGKSGYRKVDPSRVQYHQPDFRPVEEIDASGGPVPIPFQLILRRVGRETAESLSGAEVRRLVTNIYRMYGQACRPQDMAIVWRQLDSYPPADETIALVPPSA